MSTLQVAPRDAGNALKCELVKPRHALHEFETCAMKYEMNLSGSVDIPAAAAGFAVARVFRRGAPRVWLSGGVENGGLQVIFD